MSGINRALSAWKAKQARKQASKGLEGGQKKQGTGSGMNGCGTLHGKETRNKGQGGEDGWRWRPCQGVDSDSAVRLGQTLGKRSRPGH